MDMIKRRDAQMAYISDDRVFEEQAACRRILQKLNFMDRSDFAGIAQVVKELFGKSENAWVNPPFYCDYGTHIEAGKNLFVNYNCTIIDVAKVTIGDNVWIGGNSVICPGVTIASNTVIGAGSVVTRNHRKQHRHRSRKRCHQGHPRLVRGSRQSLPRHPRHYRGRPAQTVPPGGY